MWMDQRRQLLSALVAVSLFIAWMNVAPLLFPGMFPQKKPANKNPQIANAQNQAPEDRADADPAGSDQPAADRPAETEQPPAAPQSDVKLPEFPAKTITLGEAGFDGGFLIRAELDTRGASIKSVELTDPRYTTENRKGQFKVVGNPFTRNIGTGPVPQTFQTSIPELDDQLKGQKQTLAEVDWKIEKQDVTPDAASVTFSYPAPSGNFEVLKTYRISKVDPAGRDRESAGYLMDVVVELRNLSDQSITTSYSIQGPVGVPLEDADNTRVFREIKLGAMENPSRPEKITATNMLASALVKQYDKARQQGVPLKDWRAPVRYVGVDDQFFAALILPQGDQLGKPDSYGNPASLIAVTRPELLAKSEKPDRSQMSVLLESPELKIPAGKTLTNEYQVFFGPKRPALMNQLNAEAVIQLGWFAPVAKIMLVILGFFHSVLGMPYALAIIALTVVVRGAMIPVSRKQAIEAEKMKILAPRMKEIQEKHKNQPEEFARAYREFQKKHNYHPMMGCLPALIQLPIFLGLYNSLYHAVDLRLAQFLWIDNLAAPDRLAQLPFTVPYFGWNELNVLPFVTVVLFVIQQKMFTPPPTSDEQAMQLKMMNYMMIFIGFAFYRVPAGLCLYFIASSLWGICERMLLKKSITTHRLALAEAQAEDGSGGKPATASRSAEPTPPKKLKAPTWWDKIREAADQAKNATDAQTSQRKFSKDRKGKPRR